MTVPTQLLTLCLGDFSCLKEKRLELFADVLEVGSKVGLFVNN